MKRDAYNEFLVTLIPDSNIEAVLFTRTKQRVVLAYRDARTNKMRYVDVSSRTKTLRTKKHAKALVEQLGGSRCLQLLNKLLSAR